MNIWTLIARDPKGSAEIVRLFYSKTKAEMVRDILKTYPEFSKLKYKIEECEVG